MKSLTNIIRVVVGLLFIFSGLIKANDPLGLAYKMDEYFAVWGWDRASDYSLALSIGMNILEIVSGIALLIGWQPKWNTRLLLLLIVFFSFLTGYAVLSGRIKTCGCFGDCIPLQAWQSFLKDLILLALITLLCIRWKDMGALFSPRSALLSLFLFAAFIGWAQFNSLKQLPYVDCLPYAKGKNLLQQMQIPAGAIPDSISIVYKYKKDGKELSFDAEHFPDDFNDSTYSYIGRQNIVVRKGNAEPVIKDFALYTVSGEDTTQALLQQSGPYLFFFAKDFEGSTPAWQELFLKLYLQAKEKKMPLLLVSNQPLQAETYFNQINHFNIPVLTCDGTVMKTMLRSKTGVIAMRGAVVAGKWPEAYLNEVIKFINEESRK